MNADFDILSSRRRQSVWAPVFIAITALRRLGLGQLAIAAVLVATGRLPGPELLVVPLIVAALAAWAVVAWYRYTFVVENDTLIVDSGVVSSRRVVVPLARIQSVDIEQQLLHRPIGLVEVKIDTAGGEAEIVVSATSRDIAEALQRLTGSGVVRATPSPGETGDAPPAAPQREVLAKRSASDLVVMALTNRPLAGLVLIAPLMGMADDVLGTFGLWPESAVPGDLPQVGSLAVSIALTLVVALGALVALQIAWTFVTEFDLTLSRDDRVLRRESGLFDRRSASSAITRIQQLETDQSLLQRLVDHRTIRLPTAGESDSLRLPGASRSELDVLRCLTIDADARLADLERTIDPKRDPVLVSLARCGGAGGNDGRSDHHLAPRLAGVGSARSAVAVQHGAAAVVEMGPHRNRAGHQPRRVVNRTHRGDHAQGPEGDGDAEPVSAKEGRGHLRAQNRRRQRRDSVPDPGTGRSVERPGPVHGPDRSATLVLGDC